MQDTNEISIKHSKKYLIFLFFILALVQILDAYSTGYTSSFPSKIIEEFLSGYPSNQANAILGLCTSIASIGMYMVFFNQYFADKIGRKKMLTITTFGMGISALFLALSTNIMFYTIFLFTTKRASYINIVLMCGMLGPIMMPTLRSIFITETSPVGSWRGMTLFPILLGIPLAIIIIFTIKETSKYQEIKSSETRETPPIFLKKNIAAIFKSNIKPEFIVLLIMSFFAGLNFFMLQFAESFINLNTSLPESKVNLVITVIAIALILGYLLTGILADKIGRVPLLHLFSVLMPLASILLYIGSFLTEGTFILVSLGAALAYVSYYGLTIVLRIVLMEIVPTDKRGTGMGVRALINAFGITSGFLIGSGLTFILGLGIAFMIMSFPLILNIFLTIKYIKETKGTDLSKIELKY
ncbi:MAG: MFS transporter [Promethearchaeota archaeon]